MAVSNNKGFTLIELLVTLAISSLLVLGIASSMASMSKTQTLMQDYSGLQEELSFVNTSFFTSAKNVEGLINTEAAETTANKLSFELKENKISCLFTQPTTAYYQTYFLENGNLVCEVKSETSSETLNKEILVNNIESLSFACAETNTSNTLNYQACNLASLSLEKVGSVKIIYKFNPNKFKYITNGTTQTLVIAIDRVLAN